MKSPEKLFHEARTFDYLIIDETDPMITKRWATFLIEIRTMYDVKTHNELVEALDLIEALRTQITSAKHILER